MDTEASKSERQNMDKRLGKVTGILGVIVLALLVLGQTTALAANRKTSAQEVHSAEGQEETGAYLRFAKNKRTIYPGNTVALEYESEGVFKEEGDVPSFASSDKSVVEILEDGSVHALKAGEVTVTMTYGEFTDVCTVTVKTGKVKATPAADRFYVGQDIEIRLKNSLDAQDHTCEVTMADGKFAGYYISGEFKEDDRFVFKAVKAGSYSIKLGLYDSQGQYYFDTCEIKVIACGPKSTKLAVAVGCEISLGVKNAKVVSFDVCERPAGGYLDDEWYFYDYFDWVDGSLTYSKGKVKGKTKGVVFARLTYDTTYGERRTDSLLIYVTDPKLKEEYKVLKAGVAYSPELDDVSEVSQTELGSSDTDIVAVESSNYGGDDFISWFEAKAYGKAKLVINVDGREFVATVKVYDPDFGQNMIVMKPKKSKKLKLSGIPEGATVTYKTSDKSVVRVNSAGKVKAVGDGVAVVTASVDGVETYCSITVGEGKGVEAVAKALAVLGSTYSQSRRMEEGYYDCSSLAWRSYRDAGMYIADETSYAPTAAGMAQYFEKYGYGVATEWVDPSNLLPGDLIFYSGSRDNGRYKKIDHVAIFVGKLADPKTGVVYPEAMIVQAGDGVEIKKYTHRKYDVSVIARPAALPAAKTP